MLRMLCAKSRRGSSLTLAKKVSAVAFLPYVVAGLSLATLLVAIWSLRWPRTKGTIDVSIFDREWVTESSGSEVTVEKKGKFYLAYSYSVGGALFQRSRIAPLVEIDWQFSGAPDLSNARGRAHWYREGATVDVSYCPLFPGWSCLEPGGFVITFLLGVTASILFFVV